MAPLDKAHAARPQPWQLLLAILAIGLATLLGGGALFGVAFSANAIPPFYMRLQLSHHQILDISIRADCPEAMPTTACRRVGRQFPRAFKVVYWSAGEKYTLVSISQPRR